MKLNRTLLKIGIRELNAVRMRVLVEEADDDMIRWAFENGRYDVRLMAVQYFAHSITPMAERVLTAAIFDDTATVSFAAITVLDPRKLSDELREKVEEQKQFWIEQKAHREERRNRDHMRNSSYRETKERGSKKSFNNLRAMLMKPMNTGKWF